MNAQITGTTSDKRLLTLVVSAALMVILAGGTRAQAATATAMASARILSPAVKVAVDRVPSNLTVQKADMQRGYVELNSGLDRKRWEPSNQAYQVSLHVQAPGLDGTLIVKDMETQASDVVRINLEKGAGASADGSITLIYHNF